MAISNKEEVQKKEVVPGGRKFFITIVVCGLILLGMTAGTIAAANEFALPWLAVTLPILAGVPVAYMGANAYQKSKENN